VPSAIGTGDEGDPMGQLMRGRIEVQEGSLAGESVEFMFNPGEYTISKANTWSAKAAKGSNVPKLEFGGGEPRQLQLELFFDAYLPRSGVQPTDVRKLTNKLFNMMMIDTKPPLKGPHSKMGRPPKCRLIWGDVKNQFDCYITNCQVKYLMFDEQGVPVRATASLTMKEERDQTKLLPTNPTSVGEPGRKVWVVNEGDRLDWIAYQEYGDASRWRNIADANHLDDPMDLHPGMSLIIPPP
jgi:nucleoid-associated protein YgaU